jgi:transcription initiation factor TFIID subunit TAF12
VAQHRRGETLEARDIAFSLKKYWGTEVPGFGGAEAAPAPPPAKK